MGQIQLVCAMFLSKCTNSVTKYKIYMKFSSILHCSDIAQEYSLCFWTQTGLSDLTLSSLMVSFTAGKRTGDTECVTVHGLTDTIAEGTEVISVTIEPSPDYVVNALSGFTQTVTINVFDNDGE